MLVALFHHCILYYALLSTLIVLYTDFLISLFLVAGIVVTPGVHDARYI